MATTNFVDDTTVIVADWLNDVDAHVYNQVTDAHTAANISFSPTGAIAATDVQTALAELDTEKSSTAHDHTVTDLDTTGGSNGQVLTANGSGGSTWTTPASPSLTDFSWLTKTTTYTTADGEGIFADTSGGAWTLTLPATPSAGDRVAIIDYDGSFSSNNLTVGRNGTNIMGSATDLVCDVAYVSFELYYVDATQGWKIR